MFPFSISTLALLAFIGMLIFAMLFSISSMHLSKAASNANKKQVKGIINKLNYSEYVSNLGKKMPNANLVNIFNRAKNPWRMTIPTFQFIRYFGCALFAILTAVTFPFITIEFTLILAAISALFFWYPMYYYKTIGDEREAEWNKMYEFIWVLKHNLMMYDPARTFMNTKLYIESHAPHNAEMIQGFDDFYKYWSNDAIDSYIQRFYPFSVTREIYQIIFNMNKTGEFPEDQLNALREFIINAQNLTVEKTLSGVSGKATISSLPFLMTSVIVALMIPLIFQLTKFF